MQKYFGYIRVSTVKKGQLGVSLQEQRAAIEGYATRNGLSIVAWFEETETAAKQGRPVFGDMLARLEAGEALGVIIHKIDRSARNLRDWADLGELIDKGKDVHFTTESLDLHSRGGRLSADIQAVVAADFIRNLREETRKGFYGRLKQGLYPLPAPLGYLNHGRGKPKTIDPVAGPLVREAFERYATGRETLKSLRRAMKERGLQGRRGKAVSLNGLSTLLRNPFYAGIIRIHRTGETFKGVHEPLISVSTFDAVQAVLDGKCNTRAIKHDFLFRRLITCALCGRRVVGESQKGHIYYRCHTKECLTKTIREEAIDQAIRTRFAGLKLDDRFLQLLYDELERMEGRWREEHDARLETFRVSQRSVDDRLARLTDAYVDGALGKEPYEERRTQLIVQKTQLEEQMQKLPSDGKAVTDRVSSFLEQATSLHARYVSGNPYTRREVLKIATSNRWVKQKSVEIQLEKAFEEVEAAQKLVSSDPCPSIPRTLELFLGELIRNCGVMRR